MTQRIISNRFIIEELIMLNRSKMSKVHM
jgi:hypothetical protein